MYKGTPAFMAPEVINTTGRPTQISERELKEADIWSLGMLLFCLINPGCKVPFQLEAKNHAVQHGQWQQYFKKMITSNERPTQDPHYDGLRATAWVSEEEAFQKCTVKDPSLRPSLSDVSNILNDEDKSESYPLNNHQGTALERAHDNFIRQNEVAKSQKEFIAPSNDGTNACIFLALKICEDALKNESYTGNWEKLKSRCEKIIDEFPNEISNVRDKGEQYELQKAYELMKQQGCISALHLEKKSTDLGVYSADGRNELYDVINTLEGTMIMLVPPYAMVLGKVGDRIYLVDTHRIAEDLGGNGNAIIKVFPCARSAAKWIWNRLYQSVKSGYQEIVSVALEDMGTTEQINSSPVSHIEDVCSQIQRATSATSARSEDIDWRRDTT